MKIIFKGLGPTGNVVHEENIIEDGAIVKVEDEVAKAYIKAGLAYEVIDELEAIKIQEQVRKNKERRKEVSKAAGEKKGGNK
jgi:carbonic anhydrase/acetyltransferase-like protein (isoleucine patch superfamily)